MWHEPRDPNKYAEKKTWINYTISIFGKQYGRIWESQTKTNRYNGYFCGFCSPMVRHEHGTLHSLCFGHPSIHGTFSTTFELGGKYMKIPTKDGPRSHLSTESWQPSNATFKLYAWKLWFLPQGNQGTLLLLLLLLLLLWLCVVVVFVFYAVVLVVMSLSFFHVGF